MSRRGWVALLLSVWLPVACAAPPSTRARPDDQCIGDFRSGTDYFPDKTTVLDAANFTLSYHDYYQVLTVKQPYPLGQPESYVLVRCGAPAPPDTGELAGAQRITVPVTSLYSGSTTQLGMIAELGRTDVVTGVADATGIVNPQLRQLNSYAVGGRIDTERVVAAHPDVLVSAGVDEPAYPTLRQAGVPVLADAEWLEPTPLGRAEWIKVLAALTGTEKQAGQLYRRLGDDYAAVARASAGTRPTEVLPGTMYQGTWSMPTGGDYAGRLISDAGGSYPWADATATGSLSLTFESVYARAGRAPVWLVFDSWRSIADAVADDSRYTELSAVRDGQVWTAGGSDYWERGPARPDLVLSDLAAILHPDLAPHHRFAFYHRVPRP